ncbi:MAG: proline iminopeptidase-family hydrolase [Candidatus Heimdallarchaeota archaeon]
MGSGDAVPLLALHGGPGIPHNYLEPLVGLANECPIVFYDQLGCGKSDRPFDLTLWRVERFVEELGQVRKALNLEQVHILGHSWGSMLAVDYALTQPLGLVSLILASPCLSVPRWIEDVTIHKKQLPIEEQEVIDRHETAGTTDSEEYEEAVMVFYHRYLCRLDPWPAVLEHSLAGAGWEVYHTMWGPSEFFVTGNLKNYDRTSCLHEISISTLFTCGRYDEALPKTTAGYQSLIPGAKLVIFEQSSHMPHLEEKERYLQVVGEFLNKVE